MSSASKSTPQLTSYTILNVDSDAIGTGMKKLSVNDTSSASTGSRESCDPLESDFSGDENEENHQGENGQTDSEEEEEEEVEEGENDLSDRNNNVDESKYGRQQREYELDDFQILKTIGEWKGKQISHISARFIMLFSKESYKSQQVSPCI
jgi:hypothetical protein